MCTEWTPGTRDAVWRALSAVVVRQPRRVRVVNGVRRLIARPLFWLAAKIEPPPWPSSGVVWHPTAFETVRLARDDAATGTLGAYLMGPPSQSGASTPSLRWTLDTSPIQTRATWAGEGDDDGTV